MKNTAPIRQRLRLMWSAWRRTYLFGPALAIVDALTDGRAEMESKIVYKDGSTQTMLITIEVLDDRKIPG